jgi:type I restriction enzyme S subunit
MSAEWTTAPLGSVGDIITGKTPPTTVTNHFGGPIPFITPSDMNGQKFLCHTVRTLSIQGLNAVRNNLIPKGAIVVSCIGSDLGKVGIAVRDSVTNQQINSVIVHDNNHAGYVYYYLFSLRDHLKSLGGGSAVPIVNKTTFSQIQILLPPLAEQKAIAHILGTLDDKIELNRKMNETLEAMARALFKSWFVDFDPVRKKQAGEATGLPPEIDALFPSEFEDSALGKIPKGWRVGKLSNDIAINYGNNMPKSQLSESGFPVYGAGGVIGFTAEPMFDGPRLLITCRGSGSGQLFETTGPAFVTNNSLILEAQNHNWRHYLREAMSVTDRTPFVTGSAQPQITIENLGHLQLMWPSESLLNTFHLQIEPFWLKKIFLQKESQSLMTIRDTLLPKLISGELRVSGSLMARING